MSQYFPKSKSLGSSVEVELHLPNYAKNADLIHRSLLKELI